MIKLTCLDVGLPIGQDSKHLHSPFTSIYFLFERTYGNKNRGEFIDRTDRKRGRKLKEKRLWTGATKN